MAGVLETVEFPLLGLNRAMAYAREIPSTTPDCLNVRSQDVYLERLRGGSRPGLVQILPPKAFEIDDPPDPTVDTVLREFTLTKDAFMRSSAPTTNYANDNLKIGVGYNNVGDKDRFVIHFDMSIIPTNATVTAASLTFTALLIVEDNGDAAKIRRLNQTGWSETQATWNVYTTGNSWSPVNEASPQTGPYTTPPADVDWNLPLSSGTFSISNAGLIAMTQDAITSRSGQFHAMLMLADETVADGHAAAFRSRTYGIASQRPSFSITYTVVA